MIFYNIMMFLPIIFVVVFFVHILKTRSKYKNRKKGGPFFFEYGCLVVNTGLPYPIKLEEIEYVEIKYSSLERDGHSTYGIWTKVIKKDGTSKSVFYKANNFTDHDMPFERAKDLEERGIRCVLVEQ